MSKTNIEDVPPWEKEPVVLIGGPKNMNIVTTTKDTNILRVTTHSVRNEGEDLISCQSKHEYERSDEMFRGFSTFKYTQEIK